jgi:hypothetical protein
VAEADKLIRERLSAFLRETPSVGKANAPPPTRLPGSR